MEPVTQVFTSMMGEIFHVETDNYFVSVNGSLELEFLPKADGTRVLRDSGS